MSNRSVAVIGSFRQHHKHIQEVCSALKSAGVVITSPCGVTLIQEGIEFVRFTNDNVGWSDPAIQSLALHRIFRADFVYVVSPGGYIGRTTCYEVGRVIQNGKPIYFSARPLDLPLEIPDSYILDSKTLIKNLANVDWKPRWLFKDVTGNVGSLERELIEGKSGND